MDGIRFDALARSLSIPGSRRRALGGLLLGSLGLLSRTEAEDAIAHNLKAKCKKKSGEAKKKCLKKAKKHQATHSGPPSTLSGGSGCTPDCAGKACGDDGCGGSCDCTGGTCDNGVCTCTGNTELCGVTCEPLCPGDEARNPTTCECCVIVGQICDPRAVNSRCCSGPCEPNPVGDPDTGTCSGKTAGESCEFDGQCSGGNCTGGFCQPCARSHVFCGGLCWLPCQQGQIRSPSCSCCIPSGASCTGAGNASKCCAGADRCTGSKITCQGLPDGAACTFDEQCTSQFGCHGGSCGS
jgi:hypothetical protein